MSEAAKKDPMHGKTLKAILTELVDRYGWDELAARISINCFAKDPSLSSSLKFLRKTPWARNKVEALYRESIGLPPLRLKRPEPKARVNPWTGRPYEESSEG